MTDRRILLLGAGGHARVVLDLLHTRGRMAAACLDLSAPDENWPQEVPWLGTDDELASLDPEDWHLINCIGSTGRIDIRKTVFQKAAAQGFSFDTIVHSSAVVSGDTAIGPGSQIMAAAIVQAGAQLGANVLINTGAIVDHDAELGDHSHIAPGAVLSGAVSVGEAVHIGTGAVVRQGVTIGSGALIGAGAVVIGDVPAGECYIGNPARALASAR